MNVQAIEEPAKFMEGFKEKDAYRVWCHSQFTPELEKHLKALESVEIYDACAVVRDVIKCKKEAAELSRSNRTIIYPGDIRG